MTYKLVLLRHGQSEWNEKNLFTGWVDVNLTDKGRAEAQRGGELLKERHILPDVVHTSLQRRDINTANTVSYQHLRAHATPEHHVCRLLLEKQQHKQ